MDKQLENPAKIIRDYISFDGQVENTSKNASEQSILQSKGTAALWQRLQGNNFAYLADEVGMGKTRQAMAIMATQFLQKPESRIVIICPGRPLQDQWVSEWNKFVTDCLLIEDGILKSLINPYDTLKLTLHNRLKDFAKTLLLDEEKIHLLRYSSFSRPIGFQELKGEKKPSKQKNHISETYKRHLHEIGINALSDQEKELIRTTDTDKDDWRSHLTYELNKSYAKRFSILLDNNTRNIDLVICDEAQYLRHTGNARNTNINASIGKNKTKWLFLSATPLHNGPNDLKSLDNYICTHTSNGKVCVNPECSQITAKMDGVDRDPMDVVEVMRQFLVRRPRTYTDHQKQQYNKSNYRDYKPNKVSAANDAFATIVTALVQKKLVEALAGKNNKFRQGECSSFESLTSSVGKKFYKDSDDVKRQEHEYETSGNSRRKDDEEAPDRSAIDLLNHSLQKALNQKRIIGKKDPKQIMMPHAKIYEVAERLRNNCIRNSPNHKSLVFVRRLDTVDELMLTVQRLFQNEIDSRISLWASYLSSTPRNLAPNKDVNSLKRFWSLKDQDEDPGLIIEGSSEDESSAIKQAATLPYFQSISAKSKTQNNSGLLYSFLNRLLQNKDDNKSPLSFLAPYNPNDDQVKLNTQWEQLLKVIYYGQSQPEWLSDKDNSDKIQILKRAMLQSMRRSDFLVDLYIMHTFLKVQSGPDLGNKLIYIFELARNNNFPEKQNDLNIYFNNWLERLKNWCDHFSLIYEKCFQSGSATNFTAGLNSMNDKFLRMGPILGRSGRMDNKHAVTQFKMPCYPNILVCTDVLKEGVDMHLFCDEVIHYGVAWTSGDLEQRIGRVDRVKSLIHRKISTYHGLQRNDAPKLSVGFPFLGGTLDQHQVLRVIKEKKVSDVRMDFGKSEDEVKEITLKCLQDANNTDTSQATEFEAVEYYPLSILNQTHHIENICFAYQKDKHLNNYQTLRDKIKQLHYENLSINATSINKHGYIELDLSQKIDDKNILKHPDDFYNHSIQWKYKKYKRKYAWTKNYKLFTSIITAPTILDAFIKNNSINTHLEPQSIKHADDFPGFEFCYEWNTIFRKHTHEAPFQQSEGRSQSVILEKLGDYILARSPVIHTEEVEKETNNLEQWVGERNTNRKFGYLSVDSGIIWLCFLITYPEKHDINLKSITDKLSLTADRLQLLYSANDNEIWNYLSPPCFSTLSHKNKKNFDIQDKILQENNFADDTLQWLELTFRCVVRSMCIEEYDEPSVKRIIKRCNARIKKNGLIYIQMPSNTGVRFRLSAYLDFTPNKDRNITTLMSPRVIWQLVTTPVKKGTARKFEFFNWKELPHNDYDVDDWENQTTNTLTIHTYKEDRERYLVLYHQPDMIDGRFNAFTDLWAKVLPMIKDGKFQKTHIFKNFVLFSARPKSLYFPK